MGWWDFPSRPIDVPVPTRHLDGHYLHTTLTDKIWGPSCIGAERVVDGFEISRLSRGLDEAEMRRRPGLASVVNTNSPLRVDGPMLDGLMTMARFGQCVIVTPFTLAGAMSPITLAGALAQQNAEALGVIAFLQMVAPGSPCMYGGFTSNVDMKSGAPAFGTPEFARAALAGGQLARRYGLPYRSSNCCSANVVDAQAAYESQMAIWGSVMGYSNYLLHSVGWLEGGLVASFEKAILDAEMLQDMAAMLMPLPGGVDPALLDWRQRPPPWRGRTARPAARQSRLEAAPRRIRSALSRARAARGHRGLHRPTQERGRRQGGVARASSRRHRAIPEPCTGM